MAKLTVSAGSARKRGFGAVTDVSVPALNAGATMHAGLVVAVSKPLVARRMNRTCEKEVCPYDPINRRE